MTDAATSPVGLRLRRLAVEHGPEARKILKLATERAYAGCREERCEHHHDDLLLQAVDDVEKEIAQ